jgi:hypothetical protein
MYDRGNSGVPRERERFSGGNEERENRYWIEGEEKSSECAMRRERQLRTCGMDVAK